MPLPCVAAIYLPDGIPRIVYAVPQVILIYAIASKTQARMIIDHRRDGGKMASGWAAFGISLLSLILVFVPLLAVVVFVDASSYGTHMNVPGTEDEIYYSGDATEQDANSLITVLTEEEFLGTPGGVTVLLSKSDGVYEVSFLLIDGAWDEADTVMYYTYLGEVIADAGFERPLMIHLCNVDFEQEKTVRID
jgi:hypothetical protein